MKPKPETHNLKCNKYEATYVDEETGVSKGVCKHCSMWEVNHPVWTKKPTGVMLQRRNDANRTTKPSKKDNL